MLIRLTRHYRHHYYLINGEKGALINLFIALNHEKNNSYREVRGEQIRGARDDKVNHQFLPRSAVLQIKLSADNSRVLYQVRN